MCNFPKQTVAEAIGGPRRVVCRKRGRCHGSDVTPDHVDELRPLRNNYGHLCTCIKADLARAELAHQPFHTAAVHTALLSASSYTEQGSVPPKCFLLVMQTSLERASRPGGDQSQLPARADTVQDSQGLALSNLFLPVILQYIVTLQFNSQQHLH